MDNAPKTEFCQRCLRIFVTDSNGCPWCQLKEAHAEILRFKHALAVERRDWSAVDALKIPNDVELMTRR